MATRKAARRRPGLAPQLRAVKAHVHQQWEELTEVNRRLAAIEKRLKRRGRA